MSSLKLNKITHAMSLAALMGASISAPVAFAADAAAEEEVEVIQVRGIRGSLKEALNSKRFSNSMVDAVNAEDIGKFPDKNVAESLQRVPGVTIQRQWGEGAAVSIRGAGEDLTLTTLNGQNVASTGWFVFEPAKRSFNYSLLPSELVGNLEVYKSSQADLAEGGIGGTVVVKTRKPLDLDANTVYASVEGLYQGDSEETDPQISGMYSWKNEDETFGVLVSAVMQERSLERRGNEAFWQWGAGPVAFESKRERSAATLTLQYAPTEELDFSLNVMKMEMEADNTNYALWLTQADTTWGNTDATEAFLGDAEYGLTPVKGPLNVAFYQARPREATMETNVVDFEMNYQGDGFKIHAQVGKTDSDGGTDFEMVLDDGTGGTAISNGVYDFTGSKQAWQLPEGIGEDAQTISSYDPGTIAMGTGTNFNKTPKTDEETYFQGDVSFDVELGPITQIKTGLKFAQHETTSRRFEFQQDPTFNTTFNTADYNDGSIEAGTDGQDILKVDASGLISAAKGSITGETEDFGSYSMIEEDNLSAYVMADYSTDGIRGNFGVRIASTDADATFYVDDGNGFNKETEEGNYTEVLPSFNMAMDLADDLILRTSAARVMARPQYVDMYTNPNVTGTNDDLPNNQFWIVGNVGLDPFIANQFDLGLEWYFNDASLASIAYFRKDVKNFVTFTEYAATADEIPYDLPRPEEAANGWTVQTKDNGKDATIEGVELQLQYDFGNGFGSIVNYTFTDSDTPADTFTDGNPFLSDSSKHSYNVAAYFENDVFQTRIAYNWRDEYMMREVGAYGNRLHDSYGTLDFSAVYHVTENIDIKLDVTNITEEGAEQVGNNQVPTSYSGFADGFPLYQYDFKRNIAVGASFRF